MIKFKWETEFKQTEIGEVPGEWEAKSIGQITKKAIVGSTPLRRIKEYWEKGTIPWLTNKEVQYDQINFIEDTKEKITPHALKRTNLELIPPFSLIVSFTASVGKVVINKIPITTNQQFISFILNDNEDVKFYAYYLLLSQELIESFSGATPFSFITKEKALQIPIPLPPPSEQSRIATVLSWFDDLIENKKRHNKILEKTAMAIFKSWFVDFEPFKDEEFVYSEELGKEIPKGWEVQGVSAFADISLGGTPKREESKYWNGSIKWATAKDVANTKGIYILETAEYISEEGLNHSNAKILPQDSIIITARGTVGEIRLLGEAISFNQTCYGLIPKNNIGTYYLFLSLKHTLHEIKALSYGTVFDTITMKTFDEMKILVPPPPIIQKFHSLVEPLFQKIILNQKQIMVLRKVRDALLPMLVFGRLRVVEVY